MARDAIGPTGFDLLVNCPFNAAVLPSLSCRLMRLKAPLLLLACLLAPLVARAQEPQNPAGPPLIPPPPPIVLPPVAPVPGSSSSPGGEEMVQMQLPNADVRDVLSYYERLTGKRLVLD